MSAKHIDLLAVYKVVVNGNPRRKKTDAYRAYKAMSLEAKRNKGYFSLALMKHRDINYDLTDAKADLKRGHIEQVWPAISSHRDEAEKAIGDWIEAMVKETHCI
jgi:hypothetical protein